MKIEKVKNEITKKFNDLKVGEPFALRNYYFPTDIYIKTYNFTCEDFVDENEDWDGEETYNALQLRTGDPFWCNELAEVVVPNCKIIIE